VRAVKVLLASLRSTLTPPPLRQEEVAKISREEICHSRKRGKRLVPRTKLLRLLNKVSCPFYAPRRDPEPPLDSLARSSTNPSTVDDFAARASVDWRSDWPDLHKALGIDPK
jgi:hypothetical protein